MPLIPPRALDETVLIPTLAWMATHSGLALGTPEARAMLLAIATQESDVGDRDQGDDGFNGPALGLWQFERIGVEGVLTHPKTADLAAGMLDHWRLPTTYLPLWAAIEHSDLAACVVARLLLWTHPAALPRAVYAREEGNAAWLYYRGLWRPGKPHPARWPRSWGIGCSTVSAETIA